MPFLFRTSTRFIIVDEKPRQGIFYQIYDKEGFLRPALIHPSSALTYSATLDHHDNLHVVVQNTNHQTAYYHSFETSPTKRTVLEDTKNMYQFENMSIQILGETPHLFYTVIHPNGNGRSLVHQSLNAASPMATHLITNLPLNCQLSYYVVEDTLYILYPLYEEGYTLNCLTFTENAYDSRTLVRSNIPISDWNMCLHGQKLYVLFTTDTYGHPAFHRPFRRAGAAVPHHGGLFFQTGEIRAKKGRLRVRGDFVPSAARGVRAVVCRALHNGQGERQMVPAGSLRFLLFTNDIKVLRARESVLRF